MRVDPVITVIDYGMGNLGSILNMLKKVGADARLSCHPDEIRNSDKLILPGVGAFDSGMGRLVDFGIKPVLHEAVISRKVPILGICLGMQLMAKSSDEGSRTGLGWLDAKVVRFVCQPSSLKIPHMGWNTIRISKECVLYRDMPEAARFYFVHSYHVACADEADITTQTFYGTDIVSSFQRGNIFGVQFHPEKSHKFGMKLLRNFAEMVPYA